MAPRVELPGKRASPPAHTGWCGVPLSGTRLASALGKVSTSLLETGDVLWVSTWKGSGVTVGPKGMVSQLSRSGVNPAM